VHEAPGRGERRLDAQAAVGSDRVARVQREIQQDLVDLRRVDVDRRQIAWAARHLPGRFEAIPLAPPTAFAPASFDVIFSISVFTHLDEPMQEAWLAELARLLRPGGLLLATTHAPEIARSSPGVTAAELAELEARGFLFRPSVGPFNEQSAFHS